MSGSRKQTSSRRTHVSMTNRMPFQLMSTEDLADFLGVSVRTVEDWRSDRKGPPHVRIGPRTVRYRSDEVLFWLSRHDNDGGIEDFVPAADG